MSDMWTGEKVRLRGVEPEDWQGFRDLDRSSVDARNSGLVEAPRSDESFRSWTDSRAGRAPGGESFRLVVESVADGAFVGSLTVGETDNRAGCFKTGIAITTEQRRKGYAAEATELLLTYMFAEQRLHKCEVEIYAFNEGSIALYRKLGFVEEGRLREHEFFAGTYHDVVLMGITADEHWATHQRPPVR